MMQQTSTKSNNSFQENIKFELVQLLYSQAKPAIVGSLIVAIFLVYGLHNLVSSQYLYGWFGLMCLVAIARYSLVKVYQKQKPKIQALTVWKNLFIIFAFAAGIVWSIVGFLIPFSGIHQTFIACALAGVSAGAVPYYSGSRLSCCAFIIPILSSFALWSFMRGNPSHELLTLLACLFLLLLIISCFRTHAVIYNAIKLKFENDELVTDLMNTKNEMSLINQELKNEIFDRKVAENLLRESEEQYRLVTDALPVLISYIDNDFVFRFNNKAHQDWFEKPLEDITLKPIQEVLSSAAFAIFEEHYFKIRENKPINYETIMKFGQEEERYVSITLIPHIKDESMQGVFSLISDMTPRINYLATHDSLTDLPNRSLFTAKFSQALIRAQRFNTQVALLFLDLDHFKNINDTLGHDVGDQLLRKVAERIKYCIREMDTLARLGGDEFIIILEDMDNKGIVKIASNICSTFTSPFKLSGKDIFVTTSIGISVYPLDGLDMHIVLKNADMAIYHAKEKGRNTFQFYTNEMNEQIIKKINLENDLRLALSNDELKIYYQPILDISTNKIVSLEALLRWPHPKFGFVPPSEFIPVAEDVGLILAIGEWVFRSVCAQGKSWLQANPTISNIKIAVNLSVRQFKENNLIEMIENVLKETGLDGKYITIELTESLMLQDTARNVKIIKALKNLGMTISIDDFGTGYSSLAYLRKFPIDIIKIDQSFINDIRSLESSENSEDSEAIVIAIIAMAHSLKMKVVAEGVETIEQYAFLREGGCDEAQGYLISPAIPAKEISSSVTNESSLIEYFKLHRFQEFRSSYVAEK